MLGLPTRARCGAPGLFQGEKKFVPQEGLGDTGQRIPALRINLRNAA